MKLSNRPALRALAVALLMLVLVGIEACGSRTEGTSSTEGASSAEGPSAATAPTFPYWDAEELMKDPPDWFKSIEAGMTYDEVVQVVGRSGRLAEDVPHSPGTVVYQWDGPGWLTTVFFENGLVTSRHFVRAG
jgi:hypothetical protein